MSAKRPAGTIITRTRMSCTRQDLSAGCSPCVYTTHHGKKLAARMKRDSRSSSLQCQPRNKHATCVARISNGTPSTQAGHHFPWGPITAPTSLRPQKTINTFVNMPGHVTLPLQRNYTPHSSNMHLPNKMPPVAAAWFATLATSGGKSTRA